MNEPSQEYKDLQDIAVIITNVKYGSGVSAPNKESRELASKLCALLESRPEILHYEPAKAAAAVLAHYWAGMDDDGLKLDLLQNDVGQVTDLLACWVVEVWKYLQERNKDDHGRAG